LEVEMHTDPVSVLESLTLSRPPGQHDSASRQAQCCTPTLSKPEAIATRASTTAGSRAAAAGSPSTHDADPTWWILHRLASPQPYPMAGLPASATAMVGDRTWRRCRRSVRP
jgi:hypothetical protein